MALVGAMIIALVIAKVEGRGGWGGRDGRDDHIHVFNNN